MNTANKSILSPPTRSGARRHLFDRPLFGYGFSVLAVTVAVLLTHLVSLDDNTFEFFLGAVVVSVYFGGHGGLGPGLLASALSVLALDYFFIPPRNAFAFGAHDLLSIAVFGAVAVLIATLSARLKKARADLQRAHDVLEDRVHARTAELLRTNLRLREEAARREEAQSAILEISSREQQRLGQDLHDGLVQVLTGARFTVEDVVAKMTAEGHPLTADMAIVESWLTEALTQADTLARGLYPVELERHGLMAALEELANKISKLYPVSCLFICRSPIAIGSPAAATHLYRLAQEAVSNAIKSGKAKRINIRLLANGERAVLSIADNGIGFRKGPVRNGMGLKIMEYRSRFVNGDLRFLSRASGGTLVRCRFPVSAMKGDTNEKFKA